MYSKDIERMVRTLHRQRCDPAYIRHYLQENYLLTDMVVDQIFVTCGIGKKSTRSSVTKAAKDIMGAAPTPDAQADGKVKRSDYF